MAKTRITTASTVKPAANPKTANVAKTASSSSRSLKKSKPEFKPEAVKVLLKDPLNDLIIETILDKKGHHIAFMDLRGLDGPADFFIVCEADNITLTKALSDHIYRSVKSGMGITPNHIEGVSQAKWILVDYFTTVVHIFYKDTRKYYELDQLWSDARTVEYHQV